MLGLPDLVGQLLPLADAMGLELTPENVDEFVAALDDELVEALLDPILAEEERARYSRFADLFPDHGPLRRELYARHLEFFAAGKDFRERCFLAANRVGKTVAGGYEVTAHLTGHYPHWWEGFRFRRPIRGWAAGDTNETTRDIIQLELLGQVVSGDDGRKALDGSGLIPRQCIGQPKWKQGVQDLVDYVPILHVTGGWSVIAFKSFDQGRRAFQGTAKELIWLDEECPEDVYNECLIRTATTRGRVLTTFTPLSGLTPQVLQFLPKEMRPEGV
jgi:phage terminase large subunit-like protein